jgi:hypothetical protein
MQRQQPVTRWRVQPWSIDDNDRRMSPDDLTDVQLARENTTSEAEPVSGTNRRTRPSAPS